MAEPGSQTSDACLDALTASLGGTVRDPESLAELARSVDFDTLEASARSDGAGCCGGRMMLERAPRPAFELVGRVLGISWPAEARQLVALAESDAVPLIVGWDAGRAEPFGKVYLNASDCSAERRERIADELGVPVPAHVLGVNAAANGHMERKAYKQLERLDAAFASYPALARSLLEASERAGIAAGTIVSYDLASEGARPRAVFVALRDEDWAASESVLGLLPGYASALVRAAIPFEPAPPRSVGLSLGPRSWTVYAKPLTGRRSLYSLEPQARYRAGECELAVFIEPLASGARAYERTRRYALSYRVFAGSPDRADVERLMRFVTEQVSREETLGEPSLAGLPPAPWRRSET